MEILLNQHPSEKSFFLQKSICPISKEKRCKSLRKTHFYKHYSQKWQTEKDKKNILSILGRTTHNSHSLDQMFLMAFSRKRRDLSNVLIIGNTKWCGRGFIATKYTDMGGFSKADRCCRQHDKFCPFWISGFETKYGIFNWRVGTLSHCKCDYR